MASQQIELEIKPRGKLFPSWDHRDKLLPYNKGPVVDSNATIGKPIRKLPKEFTINREATPAELYAAISKQAQFPLHRLRITKASDGSLVKNTNDVTIESTGLRNRSVIYVKDLGMPVFF